jgi:hypothetical protein
MEPVPLPSLFQDSLQRPAYLRISQNVRMSVTTDSDEVQIACLMTASQTLGHATSLALR